MIGGLARDPGGVVLVVRGRLSPRAARDAVRASRSPAGPSARSPARIRTRTPESSSACSCSRCWRRVRPDDPGVGEPAHRRDGRRRARRAFAGLRAILRPPLAYLSRRPMRTGLTTGVFAVIIGMLAMFAVFFVIFRPAYERVLERLRRPRAQRRLAEHRPPRLRPKPRRTRSFTLPTRGYIGSVAPPGTASPTRERMFMPLFEVPIDGRHANPRCKLEQRDEAYATDARRGRRSRRDPTRSSRTSASRARS